MIRLFLLYIFLQLFLLSKSFSTHIRAGEITTEVLDCSNRLYLITITCYTDTRSTVQFGGGELNFGDGSKIDFSEESMNISYQRSLGQNIAVNKFVVEHTFPAPGFYTISYFEHNRNGTVINMSNSVNTPFYIETKVRIDPFISCNNSPTLNFAPVDQGQLGKIFLHNPGAVDNDGDSLSYELIVPQKYKSTEVDSYRYPNDISFGGSTEEGLSTATLEIDNSGKLVWNAPGAVGEYNISILIKEHKKVAPNRYILVGSTIRDMQIIIDNHYHLDKPKLLIADEIRGSTGDLLQFEIFVDEKTEEIVDVEVAGKILNENKLNPSFTYDKSTRKGVFKADFNYFNIVEGQYKVHFRALKYGTFYLSDFKTITIHIEDPLKKQAQLTFNEYPMLEWNSNLNVTFDKLHLYFLETNINTPVWVCNSVDEGLTGFQLKKELPPNSVFFEDIIPNISQKKDAVFCYALVGVQNNINSLLYRDCSYNKSTSIVDLLNVENAHAVKIFPNPVVDYLSVKFPYPEMYALFRIYDLRGNLIMEERFDNVYEHKIDFGKIKNGIYCVSIKGSSFSDRKIVVKN